MDIKGIITGWANLGLDYFNLLKPELKQVAERRLMVCNTCPMRSGNTCSKKTSMAAVKTFIYKGEERIKGQSYSGCGCNLSAKTIDPEQICPIGKW